MMKHLRKLLSALLVLTMLLSALPMAAFAEEGKAPAIVTEVIDTHTHEQTEEPAVEPTIELIETPAVEETEEPSTEPTEAPAVEEADEPTEEPAVEEVEEPVAEPAEALEDATAVEPEAEAEPEPAPAVEENKDESETEEASEPAENEEDDPLSGLTDEQLAALKGLPEGFSAEVVAYAMLRSTGCQHIDLDVIDNKEYDYKKIDKEKHFVTIVYTARRLRCNDCGETLQTISYEKTVSGEYGHDWYWCGWDESESSRRKSNYSFRCDNCDERITLDPPCNHESLVDTNSEGLICAVCRLGFWPGYDNDAPKCKHSNYTVVYPGEEETVYLEWDYETHLKKKSVTFYYDDDNSWGYDAKCNDCGIWLIYENGKIDDTDYTGRSGVEYQTTSSEFEAHSFVNGVCELCGEEKVEETCQHTNTKRVENTSKCTTERKPFDDAQHEVIVTKYYELYCADCNAYICDDSTEETTGKEAHDFSNGDTCECGYKKTEETCQHTNTKPVENTSKRSEERKPFDDAQHEVIVTKYYELYCADCNAYIRDGSTEETTSKEAHDFGNGDTCECGYKKTETSEDELYVRGFTMSATEITVGDKVSFTLDIANASNGDTLTIEMLADDKFTVTFENVTVRNGSANIQHEFSNEGMRSIKFHVVGGEYCKPQTLKVNPKPTGKSAIHSVVVEPKIDQARVERLGGETFTVTVVCNLDTVCVEMYFGEQKTQDTYRSSQSYTEANGTRTFTMTYTLGEDGKSYAGSYPIVVRPLSKVDAADWKKNVYGEEKNVGKLKVTHDNEVVDRIVKDAYKHTANGHTKIQNITTVLKCKVCGATDKQVATKTVGTEEAHTMDANGKCGVCNYVESELRINEDVLVDENGRMNFKTEKKNEIKKPHYYVEAGSVPNDPELVSKILLQFDVKNNYGDVGLCNVYLSNATRALGAFVPMMGDKVCRNCGMVIAVGNDYNGMGEYLKKNGLFCKCDKSMAYAGYHFPLDAKVKSYDDLGNGTYGNVTKWLIEHGAEFGWEVLSVPTSEAYKNSDVAFLNKSNKNAARSAIKEANEGNLVIGVWSDWVKGSGHGLVAHPHPDDQTKLYTTQVGAKDKDYGVATREDSPMGWGYMRGESNGWILYCVYRGVGNVK